MAPRSEPTGWGRVRRSLRRRATLGLTALGVLPGCLTAELWRDYSWPEPTVGEQLLDRRDERSTGTLVPSHPVLENGLWWAAEDGAGAARWWLRAPSWDRERAEVAAALLSDPELCEVRAASIDATRHVLVDEVVDNRTWLELEVHLRDRAFGDRVANGDVPPAARDVLAIARPDANPLPHDPRTHLPAVLQRCVEHVVELDLRQLAGLRAPVRAAGWVFVDAGGAPIDATDASRVEPASRDDADVPLADRLAALRELALLVRVETGGQPAVLRLRPDRLWLSAAVQRGDGGRCVHRSRWFLQAVPAPIAAVPGMDAPSIAARLRVREERCRRTVHPVLFDEGLLARVALTPVTLALDLVLGPGTGDFLRWITGRRRKADEPARGGGR